MADIRIKELTELTELTDNDYFVVDNSASGGETKKYRATRVTEMIGAVADEIEEKITPSIDTALAVGSASGDIASFSDGSNLPMPKLQVGIEPQQDLHGYDAPWVGGAGKNKFDATESSRVVDGVTFTVNDDGTVVANGTSNATVRSAFLIGMYTITDNTVLINGCPSGGASNKFELMAFANNKAVSDYGNGVSLSKFSVGDTIQILAIVRAGYTANNLVFKPMIRLATETDDTFAPYSNICPISGWDEANVSDTSKNLVKWKWNSFNEDKMGIFLKGGTYTLSAESPLTNGNAYIRGTKPSGEYVSREELGLIDWGVSSTSGVYYGGGGQQTYTFNVPNGGAKIEFGKLNNNGTISAQLEFGSTATAYEPYNGTTITLDLDGTRYGGTLDVLSGVMTVDRVMVDLGTLNWSYTSSSGRSLFTSNDITDYKHTGSNDIAVNAISECFVVIPMSAIFKNGQMGMDGIEERNRIIICDNRYTDATSFKTAMNGVQLVYELATPQTIQLTPTAVKSLLGSNNVWADTGEIIDCEYKRDATAIINSLIARIEALENQ